MCWYISMFMSAFTRGYNKWQNWNKWLTTNHNKRQVQHKSQVLSIMHWPPASIFHSTHLLIVYTELININWPPADLMLFSGHLSGQRRWLDLLVSYIIYRTRWWYYIGPIIDTVLGDVLDKHMVRNTRKWYRDT